MKPTNAQPIDYLHHHVTFMELMTVYPLSDARGKWTRRVYHAWKLLGCLAMLAYIVTGVCDVFLRENKRDIADVSTNMLNVALYVGGVVRLAYYTIYGTDAKRLVDAMRAKFVPNVYDYGNDDSDEGASLSMRHYAKLSNYACLMWTINVCSTTQLMSFVPLIFGFERQLPFSAWYPFDESVSPNYELAYFQQVCSNFILCLVYVITDMFVVCVCILMAGQFVVIGNNFKNCLYRSLHNYGIERSRLDRFVGRFNGADGEEEEEEEDDGEEEEDGDFVAIDALVSRDVGFKRMLRREFGRRIADYQRAMEVAADIEDFFSPILAFILLNSVCYVIFMLYATISVQTYSAMLSTCYYLVSAFVQQFLFTYFGQLLTSKCDEIVTLLCELPWYLCDVSFQKSFLLTQIRLGRQTKMTAGKFFVLSLPTFLMMLKASFSYFTFLRQIENN